MQFESVGHGPYACEPPPNNRREDDETAGLGGTGRATETNAAIDAAWTDVAAGAGSDHFYQSWFHLLCHDVGDVRLGALLRLRADGAHVAAAFWPARGAPVATLRTAAELAARDGAGRVLTADDGAAGAVPFGTVHIAFPVLADGRVEAIVVLERSKIGALETRSALRRIHWAAGRLEAAIVADLAEKAHARADRTQVALRLLAALDAEERPSAAAMALSNALAVHLGASRVAVGLVEGRRSRLVGLSNAATFSRTAPLVRCIEAAMDEALDQSTSLVVSAGAAGPSGDVLRADRAHRALLREGAAESVATALLMVDGSPVGALCVEFTGRDAPRPETAALIEAIGTLAGPALTLRRRADRLVAGRLVRGIATLATRIFGARHLTTKLVSSLVVLAIALPLVLVVPFRVTADVVVEGAVQRAASAPFAGFVAAAFVRAGERVEEGQALAVLDDGDLRLERVRWASEVRKQDQRLREHLASGERTGLMTARAERAAAEAELARVDEALQRLSIVAPIAGIVISGDLSQRVGAPVESGEVLFEVAPADDFRVVLHVADRDIALLAPGQVGQAVLESAPTRPLDLSVTRIAGVAEPADGGNRFRVEAVVDDEGIEFLRPGMEGVGKVEVGEASLARIWTRSLVDWLRLQAWRLFP